MTAPIKIQTVRLTEYGKVHWATGMDNRTWCGRSKENAVGYGEDKAHKFADLGDGWCQLCAHGWWSVTGSKGGARVQ